MELCGLYDFEDGNELLTYAPSVLTDAKSQYEYQICSRAYSQANNGKILLTNKFTRFVNALQKLYELDDNNKPTTSTTPRRAQSTTGRMSRIPKRTTTTSEQ
jgi:hypothetical protein